MSEGYHCLVTSEIINHNMGGGKSFKWTNRLKWTICNGLWPMYKAVVQVVWLVQMAVFIMNNYEWLVTIIMEPPAAVYRSKTSQQQLLKNK